MKTKGLFKLLSVILTVAICLTTVLGCLITVNAADSNGTYTIECVQTKQGFNTAKFTVKFDYAKGFTVGRFAVDKSNNTLNDNDRNNYIEEVTQVAVVDGIAKGGGFDPEEFELIYGPDSEKTENQLEFVYFESKGENKKVKLYNSLTFEVTVKFKGGYYPGGNYPITLSDVEITGRSGTVSPTDASATAHNNFHAHGAGSVGDHLYRNETMDVVKTDETNGYTLYKTSDSHPIKCSVCGQVFDYQLLPDEPYTYLNNYTELYGVNVQYNTDGTFSLNVYAPNMQNYSLYVTKTNGDFVSKITELSDVPSSMKDALPWGAKCFQIKNLSARDINTTFLLTPVRINEKDNGVVENLWATTQQISIADYAQKVVKGEAFYTDGAAADEIEADKKVAAAVTLYGETAKEALATEYDDSASETKQTIYLINDDSNGWCKADNTFMTDGQHGDGSAEKPYVITKVTELRWLAQGSTYANTYGKYFEIDPAIGTIVMQTESNVTNKLGGLDKILSADAEGIKDIITTAKTADQYNVNAFQGDGGQFAGHLNGNGVEIVGLYSTTGLFGTISTGAVIENLSIKHSYVEAGSYAGAICGQIKLFDNNNDKVTTFKNIEIADTYVQTSSSDGQRVGVFYGWAAGNSTAYSVKVTNIFVHDSVAYSNSGTTPVAAGLVGMTNSWANGYGIGLPNFDFSDSVILGCLPYSTASDGQGTRSAYYNRIYTDNPCETKPTAVAGQGQKWEDYDITIINADDVKGSKALTTMPKLDWNSTWVYGISGEYPTFASKNYVAPVTKTTGETVYYNWTTDTSFATDGKHGTGTEDDPYIISTPDQLLAVAQNKVTTQGKYFKIADGVDALVLQSKTKFDKTFGGLETFKKLSAKEVKAGFTKADAEFDKWWSSGTFQGHFDGNGVTIYGMYCTGGHAGLFSDIKGGTVTNTVFKGCYVSTDNTGGVIVGANTAWDISFKDIIENCIVTNCYCESSTTSEIGSDRYQKVGVIAGQLTSTTAINNCFVYDNVAKHTNGTQLAFIGKTNNGHSMIKNSVILGAFPYSAPDGNVAWGTCKAEFFENIYTDVDVKAVRWANYTEYDTDFSSVMTRITANSIKGSAATTVMPDLDWNTADNTAGVWYVGNEYSYPSFTPSTSNLPDYAESAYNAMQFTTVDTYGDSTADWGLYATGINVKTNPYMTFTFAFKGINAETASDVTVTLTTESGKTYTETANNMVNNQGAGKYYLWRAKTIPVYELCGELKLSVTYKEITTNVGTVSLEGFVLDLENANRADPCKYYTTRINVAKAVMFYAKMLDERYVDSDAVDLRNSAVKTYLTAETESAQYNALSGYLTADQRADYQSVTLADFTNGSASYTVTFSESENFANPLTFTATSNTLTNTTLIPNKTYYWKATATGQTTILGSGKIRTKNTPSRFIQVDGVTNVRDMGGWKTTNGLRVKYGMLYRGAELNNVNRTTGDVNYTNITANGIATLKSLGLKTEIDLRYGTQLIQAEGTGMVYHGFATEQQYDSIFTSNLTAQPEVKTNYKAIFELVSDESNYPFYTHCSGGADRTGTYAFILNGVLGVSYEDLTRDFELTTFSTTYARMRDDFDTANNKFFADGQMTVANNSNYVAWGKLYSKMMQYGKNNGCTTLKDSIEHFLVNQCEVPQSQIDSFRDIMLGQ